MSTLREAINNSHTLWQAAHGKCSMCAIGHKPDRETGRHCVRHRDGWCATRRGYIPIEPILGQRTVCGRDSWGVGRQDYAEREPTCAECRARLGRQDDAKGAAPNAATDAGEPAKESPKRNRSAKSEL